MAILTTINQNGDSCDVLGNIFLDPLFYATSGDSAFYLDGESPCIDAGDPESPLDPDNTVADIGAYYFHQIAPLPEIAVSTDSLVFSPAIVSEADSLTLTIYNLGTGELIIDSLVWGQYPQVFYSNWNPADSLVAPADSLILTVFFAPEDTIDYLDQLQIYNNDVLAEVFLNGAGLPYSGVNRRNYEFPESFILHPPNPNPFNSSTVLRFGLPHPAQVNLTIYDICGREIAMLANRMYPAGEHCITYNAANLSSGVYLVRFNSGNYQQIEKLLLVK